MAGKQPRSRPLENISFFGRLKGLFLRLDLAVAGRCAEGLSGIAAGDRAAWRGAQRRGRAEHGGRFGWVEGLELPVFGHQRRVPPGLSGVHIRGREI